MCENHFIASSLQFIEGNLRQLQVAVVEGKGEDQQHHQLFTDLKES